MDWTTPVGVDSFSKASVMISQNMQDIMLSTPPGATMAEHTEIVFGNCLFDSF